jgi:hypothetical protein
METGHFGDLSADKKIILKRILKRIGGFARVRRRTSCGPTEGG